ncbi:hypothetical protein [Neobacillus niacini]|uniref:hypothetical protein n=1 Tax=Neobacillus niacini TaxID=86668 RepID=UPI003983C5A7
MSSIQNLTRSDLEIYLKARKLDLAEIEQARQKMNRTQAYILGNDVDEFKRIISFIEDELTFRKQQGEPLKTSFLNVEELRETKYIRCPHCSSRNRIISIYYNRSAKCWTCGEIYEERESLY